MPKLIEKKLNALSVKRISKPGRHADGSGLYLNVEKSGAKSWILRVMVRGKARTIGLGSLREVSLAEAREHAARLRKVAKSGGDPVAERDGTELEPNHVPTFETAARQVLADHHQAWKNAKHRQQWLNTMRDYAFPIIGDRPVDQIGSADVLDVLQPIWLVKAETARRVRQRMRAVFDWSIAKHHRTTMNPVDAVRRALPKQSAKKAHHSALPYAALPAFLQDLRSSKSSEVVKLALEFLVLTAARTGEILGARWDEIDDESAVWAVPAERMKAGEEHRVPLSDRCLQILEQARQFKGNNAYVFPGRSWTKPLSNMAFAVTLRRMGRTDITVHGFRSSFRDWTAERTSTPRDVCEAALAHTIRDKVEAAYRRTDLFDRRRVLMDEWSRFLASDDGKVLRVKA
jgi:integrase